MPFVPAAIESIARHWSPNAPALQFHIMTDRPPSPEMAAALNEISKGLIETHLIDPSRFSYFKEVTHISRAMYYRLLLPDVLSEKLILYLDCDVLARQDISDIFETDLGMAVAGAVVNPFYDVSNAGLSTGELYFNSGVMLIDRERWIHSNITTNTIAYLEANMDRVRMPDQDALNNTLKGKWVEINPTFNCQTSMLARHADFRKTISEKWDSKFLADPKIMHFSSSHKQWHTTSRIIYERDYHDLENHRKVIRKSILNDLVTSIARKLVFRSNPFFF
jgi:lipopolysaccharide biosynthesis glycosyltransferase